MCSSDLDGAWRGELRPYPRLWMLEGVYRVRSQICSGPSQVEGDGVYASLGQTLVQGAAGVAGVLVEPLLRPASSSCDNFSATRPVASISLPSKDVV